MDVEPTITYGTALSPIQLNAKASVPGNFKYNPSSGKILDANLHILSVTFTPNDMTYYADKTETVMIHVLRASPTIVWETPNAIVQGTNLGEAQLNAVAKAEVGSRQVEVKGNFIYYWYDMPITPGVKLPAGLHTLSVRFKPVDSWNFMAATKTVQLRVWAAEEVLNDGKDQTFSHLALNYSGHATPHYWQWIIDANKGNIPDDYKRTRPGAKIFIPEKPPQPRSRLTKKELILGGLHAEITASSLEVREVPDENGKNLRYLKKGDKLIVTAVWVNGAGDRWGQIAENEWSAITFEGKTFIEYR